MTVSIDINRLTYFGEDTINGSGKLYNQKPEGVDQGLWDLLDSMDGVKDGVVTEAVLKAADKLDGKQDGEITVDDLKAFSDKLTAAFNYDGTGEVTQDDYIHTLEYVSNNSDTGGGGKPRDTVLASLIK